MPLQTVERYIITQGPLRSVKEYKSAKDAQGAVQDLIGETVIDPLRNADPTIGAKQQLAYLSAIWEHRHFLLEILGSADID